ncbi:MAG: hypothetical protein A3B10_00730 [Candidatus Doudnabacteria bacterium RIFCSPLOWO2_01_FULL_44_21]|uniref:Peptidase S8/S53 domain-containing protein n=1 Tax=Candidatus Doudnabacteria bacterium RIFCSPLOWO2_01_FULL_44_21 TaxID=1817841 RepID=A0A1F5PXM6_9BACT|nr:MAG: hypothetical protein A3B95_00590 [Candidatus Doudnabacteria bacterium RIFCSPHIGHO2_02_FULL_43_13b]OGE94663.1 MAG: hypothetical protein A3B10_00730 [Candidatus Doudnabacteria bacterium RIFCSPLOWO2_01_FULL_44_21]
MTKFKVIICKKITVGILMPVFLFMLFPTPGLATLRDSTLTAAAITTSDPFFTTDASKEDRQWYLAKTRVIDAWDFIQGSSSVVVAVIDTGIHASHIELNDGRVIEGYNVITKQIIAAGANSDDNGHGTAVAGVIGAISNNQKGIAGINWDVKLMPVKALAADGTGSVSAVAEGIVWAADHGANIINLSIGGGGFAASQTLSTAIAYAYNRGSLVIAAAGNDLVEDGINLDFSPTYPVCGDNGLDMVLGIAASDVFDQKASFSNFGSKCIDLIAPGKRILTTAYFPQDPADNVLIYGSGTSLAVPIVSGIAALLKSANSNLSNVEIRNILLRTADNVDSLNTTNCDGVSCNGLIGKGRVNAFNFFAPKSIVEGSLVRESVSNNLYYITGKSKRIVSSFVFTQRGMDINNVIVDNSNQLRFYDLGSPLPPLEGTLIKSVTDPTVYVIHQGLKRPLMYLVFTSRGYKFDNVLTLPDLEVGNYPLGDWYWPADSTMVLVAGNPLVYVMDKELRRPVTYFVFTQRKLSFAKVVRITPDEFSHIPSPNDIYWLPPLDGTLIKSNTDPAVYVIESGRRRLLSYSAFISRKYKFSNVKTLPQVEVDVIATGEPLI